MTAVTSGWKQVCTAGSPDPAGANGAGPGQPNLQAHPQCQSRAVSLPQERGGVGGTGATRTAAVPGAGAAGAAGSAAGPRRALGRLLLPGCRFCPSQ